MNPTTIWIIGAAIVVILIASLKIINQYERGVKFTLGRYTGTMNPGPRLVIPLIQSYRKVDVRQTTIELPPQEVMTKDSVPVKIDAVVYYKIFDAPRSIIAVENFQLASTLLAQSKLRDVLGKYDLSLSPRM